MALPVDLLLSRTELPQDGARLNTAHPLAGRFVTAYLPGVSSDNLGFGGPGGITGNAHSRSAIPAGPTLRLSGSGANATTSRSFGPTPSYPLTMVVVCRQGSTGNGTITALAAASVIGGSYWALGGGSSSQVSLAARNNFGTALSMLANVPADSGGNQALNQDLVIVAQSLSASDHRLVINGGTIATSTTNIGSLVAWDRLFLGQSGGTTNLDVAALLFAHGGTALTDAQMRQIASHPREVWELFEPQRLQVLVPSSGGGSPWSVSLTESASAADTLTAATAAVVSLLEAASASDILSAATIAAVALSEAASAADAVSETYSSPGAAAVSEAASAADTLTAAAVLLRAIAEAGSGSDALAAATTMVRALTEAAVAADAVTGALPGSWSVSIAELAAAVDAIAGVVAGDELVRAPEDIVLAARARLTSLVLVPPRRRIGNILKG